MAQCSLARHDPLDPGAVALAFVEARRGALALTGYPAASLPGTLPEAYAIQQAAISLWQDEIIGWKVGRIADGPRQTLGAGRLIGPIFRASLRQASTGAPTDFPVFEGGFAAVEGEFVLRIGRDVAPGRTDWSAAEAKGFCEALFIGVETAGSPLATINDLGPTVVISDFGNNDGLILGPAVAGWQDRSDASLRVKAFIEGQPVGTGDASLLPGGPYASVAFALNQLARLKRTVPAGTLISTGAVSGIHEITAGQFARITFGDLGEIRCRARLARS